MKILYLILLLNSTILFTNKLNVAVFCSADDKVCQKFKDISFNLGKQLSANNFGLITGGSKTGLMKEVVNGYVSICKTKDDIHGILPKVLQPYNVHHEDIPVKNLKWVDSIHLRLDEFHRLANIIVVLPGGFGTLHELMDFLVHNQFGLLKNKIILINYDNFWTELIQLFKTMQKNNLLSNKHLDQLIVVNDENECLLKLNEDTSINPIGLNTLYWK